MLILLKIHFYCGNRLYRESMDVLVEDWTLLKGERNMNSGSQNKSNFRQNWRNTDFPKLGQLV